MFTTSRAHAPTTSGTTGRARRRTVVSILTAALVLALCGPARAAIFTVEVSADSGPGSLRQAILDANDNPGRDVIEFDLEPDDLVITPESELPPLLGPTDVDAKTQPEYFGFAVVELDGRLVDTGAGLWLSHGDSSVEGLAIYGFNRGIYLGSGGGSTVRKCFIGTDATGTTPDLGNTETGIYVASSQNLIGGELNSERNLIVGNGNGIVLGSLGSDNTVVGNLIGVQLNGETPNGNNVGISVHGSDNHVGSLTAGHSNIISGNGRGVILSGDRNLLVSNFIGIAKDGRTAVGNDGTGVSITGSGNTVGSIIDGGGNVISANLTGLSIFGTGADGNVVIGNHIGTDASGRYGRGNTGTGVRVIEGIGNRVGGTDADEANVISGNGRRGVTLERTSALNVVQGNTIGLNLARDRKIPNDGPSVYITGGANQIGGSAIGAGNVIAASGSSGIFLWSPAATANVIEGNQIGLVLPDGTRAGNRSGGIRIDGGASNNTIGGTGARAGNSIVANGLYGISVRTAVDNAFLTNAIYDNDGLGIDLMDWGPNANDAGDADHGANRGQNHPRFESIIPDGPVTRVDGVIESTPLSSFRIEFFQSSSCDPSGFGQAESYLATITVETDASGRAEIVGDMPVPVTAPFLTATATSDTGDTSELSPCVQVGGPNAGQINLVYGRYIAREFQGTVAVTVTRSHGQTGTVSVDYETIDDEATAPEDYTHTSGTLTFAPGEFVKTIDIPIVVDGVEEFDETFDIELSNPTGGVALAERRSAQVYIIEPNLEHPSVFVSDAQIVEGDAGTTHAAFTIGVGPSSSPVTVGYTTDDGTAAAGEDYEATTDEVTFALGETEKTVLVPVFGDTDIENDELFYLRVTSLSFGGLLRGIGEGVIADDDTPSVCGDGVLGAGEECDDGNATPGDGCEADCTLTSTSGLCTGGVSMSKLRVSVSERGDEHRIQVNGNLDLPAGTPATLDALGQGAQLLIEDLGAGGTALVDLTHRTTPIPGGAYAASACDANQRKRDGWRAGSSQTRYDYFNRTGALETAGCAPGSAQGLRTLTLRDRRERSGEVRVRASIRRPATTPVVGPLRVTLVIGADATAGANGTCGVHEFAVERCTTTQNGARVSCR